MAYYYVFFFNETKRIEQRQLLRTIKTIEIKTVLTVSAIFWARVCSSTHSGERRTSRDNWPNILCSPASEYSLGLDVRRISTWTTFSPGNLCFLSVHLAVVCDMQPGNNSVDPCKPHGRHTSTNKGPISGFPSSFPRSFLALRPAIGMNETKVTSTHSEIAVFWVIRYVHTI